MTTDELRARLQEMSIEYRAIEPTLVSRLTALLDDWNFDDLRRSLLTIEHDLDHQCECGPCRRIREIGARYG